MFKGKAVNHVEPIEERLTTLEQEVAMLKQSDELQTIALRAMVTKDEFNTMKEANDRILDALANHDTITNMHLSDIETKVIELDGKIVGLQVETRQSFNKVDARFAVLEAQYNILETRMGKLATDVDARFAQMDARFDRMDARFDQMMSLLTALASKPDQGA